MSKKFSYSVRSIGTNRGVRRIWLEGALPRQAGFAPGMKYNAKHLQGRDTLVLELVEDGVRLVSKKKKGEKELPVIDLNSNDLLSVFEGLSAVRVVVKEGKIYIMPLASDIRARRRLEYLRERLTSSSP